MIRAIEALLMTLLKGLGLHVGKLALGDFLAVIIVSGFVWIILSAIAGNLLLTLIGKRIQQEKLDKALSAVVVLLGLGTFYGGFYLYSIGF